MKRVIYFLICAAALSSCSTPKEEIATTPVDGDPIAFSVNETTRALAGKSEWATGEVVAIYRSDKDDPILYKVADSDGTLTPSNSDDFWAYDFSTTISYTAVYPSYFVYSSAYTFSDTDAIYSTTTLGAEDGYSNGIHFATFDSYYGLLQITAESSLTLTDIVVDIEYSDHLKRLLPSQEEGKFWVETFILKDTPLSDISIEISATDGDDTSRSWSVGLSSTDSAVAANKIYEETITLN